jgi:Domain of unknown function (DUF6285)
MAAPHDVPTAAELIEAVREWLQRDVMTTGGALGFNARVAVNVLSIVERELAVGANQSVEHQSRLAQLGVGDDAELAAAIRDGLFDDRIEEVKALVRASVVDKLTVANPKYLAD